MKKTITFFAIYFLLGCSGAMVLHQSAGHAHTVSVDQFDEDCNMYEISDFDTTSAKAPVPSKNLNK